MITEQERKYLLQSMQNLLDEYNYNYTLMALNKIIDEWASQKSDLIEAFKKHPNYIEGKFMIAFAKDYERKLDTNVIEKFSKYIEKVAGQFDISQLPEDINKKREEDGCSWLPRELFAFLYYLKNYIKTRTISEETTEILERIIPQIHLHAGEKSSRVINRICQYIHYDKDPDYNREFAKFADGLSPMTIKRHTILSLNPLDYLTMSFGNSWSSCHTIDKANQRNMPNSYQGMYSSGTMSYMLDDSSMVFYTVDSAYNDGEYWTQPKICRQMFHWGEEKLVQSRLYPQDNDGDSIIYSPYRNIVQEIMSLIFDFPNLWKVSKGYSAASKYIMSEGTHYRDYENFDSCTLSRIKGSENEDYFTVGAEPICISCGERHDIPGNINHCTAGRKCEGCGCIIECEDDEYWDGDYCYCADCVCYCEICDEYHYEEDFTYIEHEHRSICNHCLEEYYRECEDCGEYYDSEEDMVYIEGEDKWVCRNCFDDHYCSCDECGECYDNDNLTYVESEGKWVCDNCLQEHYDYCYDCNEYHLKDELIKGRDGHLYCQNCYEEEEE